MRFRKSSLLCLLVSAAVVFLAGAVTGVVTSSMASADGKTSLTARALQSAKNQALVARAMQNSEFALSLVRMIGVSDMSSLVKSPREARTALLAKLASSASDPAIQERAAQLLALGAFQFERAALRPEGVAKKAWTKILWRLERMARRGVLSSEDLAHPRFNLATDKKNGVKLLVLESAQTQTHQLYYFTVTDGDCLSRPDTREFPVLQKYKPEKIELVFDDGRVLKYVYFENRERFEWAFVDAEGQAQLP